MKVLIILAECLAVSGVMTYVATDGGFGPLGWVLYMAVLAVILASAVYYGFTLGVAKVEAEKGLSFKLGLQTGKRAKW